MAHASCLVPDSKRFLDFFPAGAALTKLATGFIWAEGPVWFSELNELRFSDIPNNRMMRWSPVTGLSTFRQPSQRTNGHTRDREGNMISCEHGGRCVSRTYMDGRYEVVVTHWNGKRLNSPNDVVVKSDGTIWFTDPPYGIISDHEGIRADSEIGNNQVYRLDPATKELVSGDIEAEIRRVFDNLRAIASAAGGTLDDAAKVTIFLTDLAHFAKVNEVMAQYFAQPYPARAAVGVAALPRGARVEIECVLELGSR